MSFTEILIYIILLLIVAVYFYVKKKFSFLEENGIPHIKPTSIMGNLSGVGTKIHFADFIQDLYNVSKGKDVIMALYAMFFPSYFAIDLELIKSITVKDFNSFTDRGMYVNEENDPITGHLFSLGGEKWRSLRNKLSPAFTSGKIKSMYNTISSKGDNFVKAIERVSKTGSVEMKDIANRYTIDVISSCAFGMEANTLNNENPEMVKIFSKIFGKEGVSILKSHFLNICPNFSRFLNLRMFEKKVGEFFFNIVGGSIKHREANNVIRNDFLNMLIQLKNKGSIEGEVSTTTTKLTFDECVAQSFVFFFAGADSSSSVVSYAITELAQHSDIQEKLRQEIQQTTEKAKGEITYENLNEMIYLNQVVNETLRKYPPAFVTLRQAMVDYKIPGSKHVIKKGTKIVIPNICIHYDDRYWKNPQEFNPDRFTAEESAKRPSSAFMPFGGGPRSCIGMRFAHVNVKFAVATIIKNFKITLDMNKMHWPMKFDPTNSSIAPLGGSWINFDRL